MRVPRWLLLSLTVPVLWGLWGALTEIPEKRMHPSFPPTLGYVVWAFTMVPVAILALRRIGWQLNLTRRSIAYGCAVGFSGALGQLLLFWVLREGPAYLIFPIVCLSPVVTVILSWSLLHERTNSAARVGIALSIPAIVLLALQPSAGSPVHGYIWLGEAIVIFLLWGLQAYLTKSSAEALKAEELFFYMALTALILTPFAVALSPGLSLMRGNGLVVSLAIQSLNAAGALLFVYAVRMGKAMIVVPMINGLYPLVTIVVSLLIYHQIPGLYNFAGMLLALVAVVLMAFDEAQHA